MRAASVAIAAVLLIPALPVHADAGPIRVHVRIEGAWAQRWSGDVLLGDTFLLVAERGAAYELSARTPLGALHAAAEHAGLALAVSDDFDDFTVMAVDGERWWDQRWWDYRVNWVRTNYGAQAHWQAWGPPLGDGDQVLWYVDQAGMTPLRRTDVGPPAGVGACARLQLLEVPLLDPNVDAGDPWPTLTWRPAQLARLTGPAVAETPVPAGLGVAVGGEGTFWAEEMALPYALLYHYVRSERAWLPCPGAPA